MAAEPVPAAATATLWAVVPAAGRGTRMGSARDGAAPPKQYARLGARTLLGHTLRTLLAVPDLAGVVVALAADDTRWPTLEASRDPRVHVATGAPTRAGSVAAGLERLATLAADDPWVLVHDAARPLVSLADIRRLTDAVFDSGASGGLLAVPVQDTLKRAGADHRVAATVPRAALWRAQTPQLFRRAALAGALGRALGDPATAIAITDEASAMERAGHAPLLVEALDPNPKITRPSDLGLARALLGQGDTRQEGTTCA